MRSQRACHDPRKSRSPGLARRRALLRLGYLISRPRQSREGAAVSHLRRTILVGAFLAGACVLSPWAMSGEKGGQPQAKAIELKDTAKTQEAAATVNFAKALGLSFESLNTLGTR